MSSNATYKMIFYGDDFTGSTDALEFLCLNGARAVLFMDVPDQKMLDDFPGIDAFGVAGKTRSLDPPAMQAVLQNDFSCLSTFNTKLFHYKVCSTYDSSPTVGNIGLAMEIGASIFKSTLIPVLGGMPLIGRYCLFSNLFVRMGIGTSGKMYRLDRHPSMSNHPVTPSDEADLRLHLGKQTMLNIGAIDINMMRQPISEWLEMLDGNEDAVVLDAMDENDLLKVAAWLDLLSRDAPLFTIGSSGIEAAMAMHWKQENVFNAPVHATRNKKIAPMLVVSGSQSPITTSQIKHAAEQGFATIDITADDISNDPTGLLVDAIVSSMTAGIHTIIHTGARNTTLLNAMMLGDFYGKLVRAVCSRVAIGKLLICGGDTSSHAARSLGITAVEMVASYIHGAPICKAYSTCTEINGLEMNFKGGQVGPPEYFSIIKMI